MRSARVCRRRRLSSNRAASSSLNAPISSPLICVTRGKSSSYSACPLSVRASRTCRRSPGRTTRDTSCLETSDPPDLEVRARSSCACSARSDELSSSELAEHAQLDRARTSKAVGSLVAKHLVSRVVRPGDRRQVRLGLTESGQALYEELFPLVTQINAELLGALSDDDAARLDESLHRLHARAERMVEEAVLPKADRGRRGAGGANPPLKPRKPE